MSDATRLLVESLEEVKQSLRVSTPRRSGSESWCASSIPKYALSTYFDWLDQSACLGLSQPSVSLVSLFTVFLIDELDECSSMLHDSDKSA